MMDMDSIKFSDYGLNDYTVAGLLGVKYGDVITINYRGRESTGRVIHNLDCVESDGTIFIAIDSDDRVFVEFHVGLKEVDIYHSGDYFITASRWSVIKDFPDGSKLVISARGVSWLR